MNALSRTRKAAVDTHLTPQEAALIGLKVNQDGVRRSLFALLGTHDGAVAMLREAFPALSGDDPSILPQLAIEALYAPYLDRQARDIERLVRDEAIALPSGLEYRSIPGLSRELCGKLEASRPTSLAQAGRIEGMTPAALTLLLLRARQEAQVSS